MRPSPWLWLGLPAVVGVMVIGSLTEHGTDARTELGQLIHQVAQREQVPVMRDQAIYGELHEGGANAHYRRAHELTDRLSQRFHQAGLATEANWSTALTDPEAVRLRVDWQPAIAAIRAGAHSREVSRQEHWGLDGCRRWIVWCECDCLLREQAWQAAVHVWLDAAIFVLDGDHIAATPSDCLWNARELSELVRGWQSQRLALLPDPARIALAAGLAGIDRQLAHPVDLQRFVATAARHVTSENYYLVASSDWQSRLSAWRTGFSPQQASIAAVAHAVPGLDKLVPAAEPWPDRLGQLQAFRRDHVHRHHDAMDLGEEFLQLESQRRAALAEVRLLRMTLQLLAGEQPNALLDPFGSGQITIEPHQGTTVLRSVGYVSERGTIVTVERCVVR